MLSEIFSQGKQWLSGVTSRGHCAGCVGDSAHALSQWNILSRRAAGSVRGTRTPGKLEVL